MVSMMGAPRRFHYGWIIVAVTFLILLVSAGMRAAPGVLMSRSMNSRR